jgi:hypothetical protein
MSLNGVNLNTLTPAELASLFESDASQVSTGGQHALAQTATDAFKETLASSGLSPSQQSALLNTFNTSFASGSGGTTGSSSATQPVLDAAFRNGGLAQSTQQLTDAMTQLTTALGAQGQQSSGAQSGSSGTGGNSWLEAIAKAMGTALGGMAQKLVTESNALSSLSSDSSASGAQAFQTEMTQFQADSQLFGMLSDAFSNAIKSIGTGMQTMASRT